MMRRRGLACAVVAALPGVARAFRLEPAAPDLAAAHAAGACRDAALHAALRAEIEAAFGPEALTPAVEERLAALARCPFCGCAVLAAADQDAAPPD